MFVDAIGERLVAEANVRQRVVFAKRLSKGILIVLVLVIVSAVMSGCGQSEIGAPLTPHQRYAQEAVIWKQQANKEADRVTAKMLYFKDSRTDLCFVYFFESYNGGGQTGLGGPALASVPCGSVPENMLATSSIPPPR